MFDYLSISDAILELSYTAEGDGLLRSAVEGMPETPGTLDAQLESGLVRRISLRHEFPIHRNHDCRFHILAETVIKSPACTLIPAHAIVGPETLHNRDPG